jgi:hypothetical protein
LTKTPIFGPSYIKNEDQNAVIWPSQKHFLSMLERGPVKLCRIEYRTFCEVLYQLQLFYTNGKCSAILRPPLQKNPPPGLSEIRTIEFKKTDEIVTIGGTRDGFAVR